MSKLEDAARAVLAAARVSYAEYKRYSTARIVEPRGGWTQEQWAEFNARVPWREPDEFQIPAVAAEIAKIRAEAIRDAAYAYWNDRLIGRDPGVKQWLEDLADLEEKQLPGVPLGAEGAALVAYIKGIESDER